MDEHEPCDQGDVYAELLKTLPPPGTLSPAEFIAGKRLTDGAGGSSSASGRGSVGVGVGVVGGGGGDTPENAAALAAAAAAAEKKKPKSSKKQKQDGKYAKADVVSLAGSASICIHSFVVLSVYSRA